MSILPGMLELDWVGTNVCCRLLSTNPHYGCPLPPCCFLPLLGGGVVPSLANDFHVLENLDIFLGIQMMLLGRPGIHLALISD